MCSGVCVGTHPRSCVVAPPGGVGSLPGPAARPSLAPAPPLGCEECGGEALPSPATPRVFSRRSGEISPGFICTEDAEAAAGEDLFLR